MLTDQGRSPGGARNILRALSAMTEDAITDEFCEFNPWIGIKVRDDDRRASKQLRPLRVWSFAEMHAFAVHAGRHEAMIRTLADCGLRVGELFALRRAGLDDGILRVAGTAWEGQVIESSREKNHHRTVPVPLGLQALLREMPVRIDSLLLFPSPRGQLWRYSNWRRRVWQPTIARSGFDPTPHEFRHSWVTHLRASGIDPADLADVAGHSVQTATSRYTHPLRRSFDEIRNVVG
jgi:integrase